MRLCSAWMCEKVLTAACWNSIEMRRCLLPLYLHLFNIINFCGCSIFIPLRCASFLETAQYPWIPSTRASLASFSQTLFGVVEFLLGNFLKFRLNFVLKFCNNLTDSQLCDVFLRSAEARWLSNESWVFIPRSESAAKIYALQSCLLDGSINRSLAIPWNVSNLRDTQT